MPSAFRILSLLALALVSVAPLHAEEPLPRFVVATAESELKLAVKKKGFLKAFAHDHDMAARVFSGSVTWDAARPEAAAVEFRIQAKDVVVLDPTFSEKDRAEVQSIMHSSDVLDVARFPEIVFASRSVVASPGGKDGVQRLNVVGDLTLHGKTKSITLPVELVAKDGTIEVTGRYPLTQSDFGMEPFSKGFGAIGVQDVVTVTWKVVAKPSAAAAATPK